MLFIKEILILCVIYYWLVVAVDAADVMRLKVKKCRSNGEFNTKTQVNEVTIGPCPRSGGPCELYKGTNATLTIRFTPSEDIIRPGNQCMLKAKLVWISKIEMDFGGLSPNACNYMNCSGLQVNKEAEFSATFPVSKMWPSGSYPLKLRIDEINNKGNKRTVLCQLFKVRLTGQQADIVLN